MYAVLGTFTMDRARDDELWRGLEEEVIPITRQVPGFVSGHWMNDPAGPRSYALTVWNTEEQAHAFKRVVEARQPRGEQSGVGYDSLTIVEVVGAAHR